METHLLTTRELAARLRLEPSTIRTWARDGRIPVERFSRRALRFDLNLVLRALRAEAPPPEPDTRSNGIRLVVRRTSEKGGAS